MRMRRRSVVAALLLLVLLMLLPAEAAAHQRLLRAEPAADDVATVVPSELRLHFYEPVQLAFTTLVLLGPDGGGVVLGEARVAGDAGTELIVPIRGALQAGSYTVRWTSASRDGHPVRGEYTFSIAQDAAGLPVARGPAEHAPGEHAPVEHAPGDHGPGEHGAGVTAPGQPTPPAAHHVVPDPLGPTFDADSPAYVAVRWVNYIALMGLIGAVAFSFFVVGYLQRRRSLPEHPELAAAARRRAAAVGLGFAALLAAAAVGRLYAQSLAMHGPDFVLDGERIGMLLRRTVWGWGWLLQAAATVQAVVGLVVARRGVAAGWAVAGVAALGLAVTPALSGHAAAMTGATGTLAMVVDTVHVLAAGSWLGSLLVLLVAGIPAALRLGPARRGPAVAALVHAFSPGALLFAGLLVATGVTATIIHSSSLAALLGSRYGTLLLIKLGIFALVFGTGAYNFLRVRPALGDDSGTRRLRRSAGFELAVGTAVLLVTAVLVATARPYDEADALAAGSPLEAVVDEPPDPDGYR
jgi:putative copper export protein/methionine-rich copper-binding protein CopC